MSKRKTTLLIDADVLAFEAAVVAEESIEWKDEMWTVHADMALAKARVVNRVEEFKDMMKTNSVTMCLTDRANFRRVLNPEYKANRSKSLFEKFFTYNLIKIIPNSNFKDFFKYFYYS